MSEHIYFGSGTAGDSSLLSNFAAAQVEVQGKVFPSSEHAFQALLKVDPVNHARMEVGGDLGSLKGGFGQFFSDESVAAKKVKHWGEKKTKSAMVGIVAKMAVKETTARKLGLKLLDHTSRLYKTESDVRRLFAEILDAKYAQNRTHRKFLLDTAKHKLVEFSRSARRETLAGKEPFWTGYIAKSAEEDAGRMYGRNVQGDLQMEARQRLVEMEKPCDLVD